MQNLIRAGVLFLMLAAFFPRSAHAESQGSDYKGITDPFGDPANYEFAEDEKEDKEFFHLGRYIMLGLDAGVGAFTGGLGQTNSTGFYLGFHVIYFFDRSIALEASAHFASHLDVVKPQSGGQVSLDTKLIPLNLGFRYYFDTREAPKAIAVANPYLAFGAGDYLRSQDVSPDSTIAFTESGATTSNFGAYGGFGMEFPIYRKHLYVGIDARYHLIFFSDANDTFGSRLNVGDRAGNYVTANMTFTYNW